MVKKNEKFNVETGLLLSLENLWAEVHVSVGQAGVVTVELDGDEKFLNKIHVSGNTLQVTIKGEDHENGGITIMSKGNQSYISVGTVHRGETIVGGSMVSGQSTIIVNGRVISSGDDVTVEEGGKMPIITVKVPKFTDLEVFDVERLISKGLGGTIDVSLSYTEEANIADVNGMRVRCSGQAQCVVENASGDLNAGTSGQSGISIGGNIEDVEADCSGQSSIAINGNCHNFNGNTSGQSRIYVSGKATGRIRQHSSLTSKIIVHQ